MIRVLVAASSAVSRAGLEALLRSNPAIEVAGSASDLNTLARVIEELQPDAVVAELERDVEEPPQQLIALAAGARVPAMILLADDPHPAWTAESLRSGVRAVLPRDLTAGEIVAAVEAAAAGLVVVDPRDIETLFPVPSPNHRAPPNAPAEMLTPREIEVLTMLAEGLGNKEVAWKLGISEHTVKFHVASIMGKLNAASRTEAVTMGIRRGLILL